jgi:hypothetical protein
MSFCLHCFAVTGTHTVEVELVCLFLLLLVPLQLTSRALTAQQPAMRLWMQQSK